MTLCRFARQLGASVVDFLDVALRARGADDVLGPLDPLAQPQEPLGAHALRQHGDRAEAQHPGDRHAAAAVVAGRRPHRPVVLGVEPAGHQKRDQAAIGGQHLVGADQRKKAAERHDDRGAHPGQLRRQQQMRGGSGKAAAPAVVVPVHAVEIGRIGPIGIDPVEGGDARRRDARGIGELGKARQPRSRSAEPAGGAIANRRRHHPRRQPAPTSSSAPPRLSIGRSKPRTPALWRTRTNRGKRRTAGEASPGRS